jgi:hypothetical protein
MKKSKKEKIKNIIWTTLVSIVALSMIFVLVAPLFQ